MTYDALLLVFKCSVWRTMPHYGRIYMTDKHLCFYSKATVGKQRLLIPWVDVTDLEKVQSKNHLACALTLSVKDIKDKVNNSVNDHKAHMLVVFRFFIRSIERSMFLYLSTQNN